MSRASRAEYPDTLLDQVVLVVFELCLQLLNSQLAGSNGVIHPGLVQDCFGQCGTVQLQLLDRVLIQDDIERRHLDEADSELQGIDGIRCGFQSNESEAVDLAVSLVVENVLVQVPVGLDCCHQAPAQCVTTSARIITDQPPDI
jgi:hypothetical protein